MGEAAKNFRMMAKKFLEQNWRWMGGVGRFCKNLGVAGRKKLGVMRNNRVGVFCTHGSKTRFWCGWSRKNFGWVWQNSSIWGRTAKNFRMMAKKVFRAAKVLDGPGRKQSTENKMGQL